jgi:uncharacterized protein (DUF885 family)
MAAMRPRLVAALLLLTGVALMAQTASPPDGAGARLAAFFASEWDWTMEQNPTWASRLGDRRWNDRWEDVSLENLRRQQEHRTAALAALERIGRASLNPGDQISYDIFKYQYAAEVEGFQYEQYLIRTNTYDGVQNAENIVDSLRFETVKDYEDWIQRLHRLPAYVDQNAALMRRGIARNVLLPKVIMRRIVEQVEHLATQPPSESGYYRPFASMPASFAPEDRRRLEAAGRAAVAGEVQPAFARLKTFIDAEYMPAAYDHVGAWQNARGAEAYAWLTRYYTTTSLTPDQIHELGLSEVARIREQMERVKTEAGFTGSLPEFFAFLRSDPRFFYKTGDELLRAYRATAKRIDPALVKVFKTTPRLPYGVLPIPAAIAPNTTTAYAEFGAADGSRPAYYFVNLYKPETRPTWEMMALTLHEAVPGHCFQGSLAQELAGMPEFRKNAGFTAYVEGWALYAESLGEEMGLYDDPYSRFGRLTYEMWRAVRLVVDTGIHVKHWTRDQAIRYFMENAAKTELDVTNEVDRYISWPAQALAYKIGELKIKELRARATARLGDRFDLRGFHDEVLLSGAMPLDVLERRVDTWITNQAAGAADRQRSRH